MRNFVICQNNALTALLTEEDYELLRNGRPIKTGYFLFVDTDSVPLEPWNHGTLQHMDALIKVSRGQVRSEDFGVPFSNGAQLYAAAGIGTLEYEFTRLAAWSDLLSTFGADAWTACYDVYRERQYASAR